MCCGMSGRCYTAGNSGFRRRRIGAEECRLEQYDAVQQDERGDSGASCNVNELIQANSLIQVLNGIISIIFYPRNNSYLL